MDQPLGQMIIKLGLDSAGFKQSWQGVDKQIKSNMLNMKAHLKVMGNTGNEIDILKVKQKNFTDVVALQSKKLEELKVDYDKCRAAVEGNTNATDSQKAELVRVRNEYVKTIGELGSFEHQLKEVTIRITAMESGLHRNGAAMVSFGSTMTKVGGAVADVGKSMMLGVTAPVVAIGTYAAKASAEFDKSMSKVSAVSGATGNDLSMLRDKAREMGSQTKFSASEAAEAMNYMAMAGWKTKDMISGIDGIMSLAAASGESLATTSDIVTDALTGFGEGAKESGRLADIMAAASSNANTNVAMMGETFKYCTPIAGALGFSMEDTALAIGLMANSGIKASMAGTSMRSMMNNLAGEVGFAGDAFGELTIQTQESDGSMRGLNDILLDCREAFAMMTEAEKVANAESLVGKNAMSGFLAVMNAAPADIEKLSTAIAESNGVANDMANTMQDNLSGQLTQLKSQTDELAISYGEILTPKLREMVSGIQGAVEKLINMDDGTKRMIVNVGMFAAAAGPTIFVIGKMTKGIGTLATTIGNGMQSFALWAAKITHTTTVTATQTGVVQANTASLLVRTSKTLLDAAASKAHTVAEKAKNVVIAAGNGTLTAQVAALNASLATKLKNTSAVIASTAAEKIHAFTVGASSAGLSAHTIATVAQTVATNACAVATGFLSAAIKLMMGPIGWIIAGITALVSGVVAVVKWFNKETEASKELKAETEDLAQANDTLVDSMDSSNTAYKDSVTSIKAETGAAKTLTERIEELSKIENKSAKQKKELQSYVGMLNDSMEGLNLEYDEQADALSKSTSEIYLQISALEEQAEAQAAQERMTEILKEQIMVNEQLSLVQAKATEVTENDNLKNRERKDILEELTTQEGQLKDQLDVLGESYAYVTDIMIRSAEAEAEAVENSQTVLEAYGSISAAYEDLGDRQKCVIDDVTGAFETMTGRLSNLTDQIKLDNETTWSEIQKNQEDTIVKTREFSELYAALIKEGVSDSYLKAIGATGPESIPLLKEMLAQGTETILASQDEWTEAYGVIGDTLVQSLDLEDSVSGALKNYVLGESGIYGTLQGAIADADLNALGKNITEGVSKGILESTDGLLSMTTQMADSTTDAAEEAWDIHSPSRVFAKIGENLMEGIVLGINHKEKALYSKMEEVAEKTTKIAKKKLDIHSPSRVMRDEVGRNISLGIAEGIEKNAYCAKKSTEDMTSEVVRTARKGLDGGALTGVGRGVIKKMMQGIDKTQTFRFGMSADIPKQTTILSDSMEAIRSIGEALGILRSRQDQESRRPETQKENTLVQQLLSSNNKMTDLLQVIADKPLVIDKVSLSNAIDFEFQGGGAVRPRGG